MGLLMGIGGVRGMLVTLGANPWRRCEFGNGWTIYFGSNDSIWSLLDS